MNLTEAITRTKRAQSNIFKMTEAFFDGSEAYIMLSPRADNPHSKDSPLHHEWNVGWDNAYKDAILEGQNE